MSEAVTAGVSASPTSGGSTTQSQSSAPAGGSAQSSSGQASGQKSQATWGNPSGQQSAGAQAENLTQSAPRELGETDMDAVVTVKINGKTEKLALREVVKLQQLEKASHEKMRTAAERERKAQEIMSMDFD